MERILLVDADFRLAAALGGFLRRQGYLVTRAPSARAVFDGRGYAGQDAVLLDTGDGLGVCRRLRSVCDAGIIVVTPEGQREAGRRAGADDCVVKPFGPAELHARIAAVLGRRRADRRTRVGGVSVDVPGGCARVGGAPLALTGKEFGLLALLTRHSGRVVARHRLAAEVWPGGRPGRSLDVHISNLRAKLGAAAVIETVHGVGYRIDAPA